MSRLRIARTPSGAYSPPNGVPVPDADLFRRLQIAVRRYLSPATATLLAEPGVSADGSHIDWYTPLTGQPVKLSALPNSEQSQARRLLQDRIRAVSDLAQKIEGLEPGTDLSDRLLQATTYPSEDAIFVVDGQPVITFWGYGLPPSQGQKSPAGSAPRHGRFRRSVVLMLGLGLVGGLTWAAFHFSLWRWPPWGPDYAAMLAAERAETDRLRDVLLDHRGVLARDLGRCALQAQLDALRQERALLGASLETMTMRLRQDATLCAQRAAESESVELWERLTNLTQQLAEAKAKCPPPAAEKQEAKSDMPDSEQQKKRAERERLRHVQVDGTLGCTGRSSRLFFKVPFDLGGGRFSVNFKGRDYDGTSITSRIDATYDAANQKMVLDLQMVDRGQGKKAIRVDRCQGTWRNGTFSDPRCKLIRTVGGGNFCNPLWLRIKTKAKLGK